MSQKTIHSTIHVDVRGVWKYYKEKNKPKPICNFCGYVALDERELHNHQSTCKKKEKNS